MSQPDYFDVAVSEAREYARQLAEQTHWIDYDAPVWRGRSQAACGSVVDVRKFAQQPTCPACRQQLALRETFEF